MDKKLNGFFVNFQYAAAAAALSSSSGPSSATPSSLLLYPPPYPLALSLASSCLSSAAAAASMTGPLGERLSSKNTSIADLRLKARRHAEALGLLEKHL